MSSFPSNPPSRPAGRILAASILGALALMTLGCLDSGKGPNPAEPTPGRGEKSGGKGFPSPIVDGVRKTGYYRGQAITYVEKDGKAYFEGDILLDKADLRDTPSPLAKSSAHGVIDGDKRWSGGKVYYTIDADIPNPERITMAMSIWSWQTSLQFLPYTGGAEPNWIRFQKTDRCASRVGMGPREQILEVADWCNEAGVLHELGHAIGLWHEQTRPDRDQYLDIHWKNMRSECVSEYDFRTGYSWGPFDIHSIMLYPSFACSLNPELPAVLTETGEIIPERTGLSLLDVSAARKMYPLYLNEAKSSTLARDIGAGAAGTAYIISNASAGNGNYTVRRFNSQATTRWESFSGSGVRIDVDINGRPWVAKANGSVQRWSGSSWATVGSLTGVKDIGIGASSSHPYGSVYVLSSAVMNGSNYSLYRWTGSTWTRTSGSGVSISVDPAGYPWTVNAAGQLQRWTGSQWQLMGEGYADIGVGPDGHVYATKRDYLYRKGAPSGSNGTEGERTFFAMSEAGVNGVHWNPIIRLDGGPGETFWTLTAGGDFEPEVLRGTVDKGTTNYTGPQ